ncbi:MAG: PAS domain-containing protein, partial [Bryobacteraceae bacterium]
MTERTKSRSELLAELEELRTRVKEAESMLAIKQGHVDAALSTPHGDSIPVLDSADEPYRILVETMNQGAATVLARSILEQAAEAIIVCDAGGRIVRISQAARKLGGDLPGRFFDEALRLQLSGRPEPDGSEPRYFAISEVLAGATVKSLEAC